MKPTLQILALLGSIALSNAEDFSHFEAKIRPVLASACYDCHAAEKQKGGLRLDWRDGLLKGGKRGPAIIPGDPDKSLLIQAMAHTHPELKMPKGGDPLNAATVGAFREWILSGAPDPRDREPAGDTAAVGDWPAAFALRKQWWCWQPLKDSAPPTLPGNAHPVDRFLRAAMQQAGISPAPEADPASLVRRAAFILTGLPPSPDVVAAFLNDPSQAAWEALIDQFLASPRFGERWARHWMDWLRYAESHGSEGDPAIPHAWHYRDYLIRSLNADVPYAQLVKEHIAGDLLPPRLSADGSINEAAIGPAHLRMVFHGFTPTDALDERVSFTDNQVDVVSKAFLGLTVSCARCHNHKFDAISQKDYFALYGIFANTRPATCDVSAPGRDAAVRERMAALKDAVTNAIKKDWDASFATFGQRLAAWEPASAEQLREATGNGHGPLAAWLAMKDIPDEQFTEKWEAAGKPARVWRESYKTWHDSLKGDVPASWDGGKGSLTWITSGHGLAKPVNRSEFRLRSGGDQVIESILPPGYTSGRYSDRDRGLLASSPFLIDGGKLWVKTAGHNAGVRYVIQNYPRSGLVYPKSEINSDRPRWIEWNLDYWKGESIHIEAWTAPDAPVETGSGDRYSFSILEVAYQKDPGLAPPEPGVPLQHFAARHSAPVSRAELLALYEKTVRTYALCGEAIREVPEFIGFFISAGLLPNTLKELPSAAPLVEEYRKLEKSLGTPVRAPGLMEGGAGDQPLYIRGDHKKPSEAVPRRFLEAIDPAPFQTMESGRRELAAAMSSEKNPLTGRVIVNRLWHHVFGRGLVATPDNFGKLGDLPTHPELLDWLALRFQENGGSIKQTLKLLLTSQAFRARPAPSPEAAAKDPENKLLSHWSLRRMEAEAIRDSILQVSGQLDTTAGGPAVDGGTPRRSVYVRVIRNDPDPMLSVFDAPVPSGTRGKRDVTNVPAQALTLMNAPLIQSWAGSWAERVEKSSSDAGTRVQLLYQEGFQRPPSDNELQQCLAYIDEVSAQSAKTQAETVALRARIADLEQEQQAVIEPVRHRLTEISAQSLPDPATLAKPAIEWDFTSGPEDAGGTAPLTLHHGARMEAGALVVDGRGYASSPPLPFTLREKTLEAWVSLDTLDQAGGGVLTVQDLPGAVFDSIVFGEKDPLQWVAGSNSFARTRTLGGPQENAAHKQPVHVAVTWAADGTITAFRNGQPYGKPYKSSGPVSFEAGKSQILLGCRHGSPEGNRLLRGRIHRARLYDHALTSEAIAATCRLEGMPPGPDELLAGLTPEQRERYQAALAGAEEARRALAALETPGSPSADSPWRSLALALINMKEFIYLR